MANINPQIAALPKDRWLSLDEIFAQLTNGKHDPALLRLLCQMDDGNHCHDGYQFEGSQGRIRFRWTKAEQASPPESETSSQADIDREYRIALREGGFYQCFPEQEGRHA